MFISNSNLALWFIERYENDWSRKKQSLGKKIGTVDNEIDYAINTIQILSRKGIGVNVFDKNVLEIGCGKGGVTFFVSMNGAKKAVGIDISTEALNAADILKSKLEGDGLIRKGNVEFRKEMVENMTFEDETFDVIIADNVLEHVNDLEATLKECKRILKVGGVLQVPNYPPIYSRNGPHLKYGAKIPWIHIFFTEKAICRAVYKRAEKYPDLRLFNWYGGLKNKPETFREIRTYKDLNYITNKKFRNAAASAGLKIDSMVYKRSLSQKILLKLLPFLNKTILGDIFSYGTGARLRKTG
ncbi:MAG: class I SAM-dependent methyltransferase [Flavobacteriales bacterium]|nr:class I SAM-dependent methyltransferase [Flavobacteriales bacterium]